MYIAGRKWSGVGTARSKSGWAPTPTSSDGDEVMISATSSSKRRVQSKASSGRLQSIRRRLWTMLPLPTISTPRSRSGASSAPSSK
jgi:hypothetical protein